jgi:hypothetical protein
MSTAVGVDGYGTALRLKGLHEGRVGERHTYTPSTISTFLQGFSITAGRGRRLEFSEFSIIFCIAVLWFSLLPSTRRGHFHISRVSRQFRTTRDLLSRKEARKGLSSVNTTYIHFSRHTRQNKYMHPARRVTTIIVLFVAPVPSELITSHFHSPGEF